MKITTLLLLALCFCSSKLYAQEMAAQVWGVSEVGQHSSGTGSRALTGSDDHDLSHFSSGTLTRVVVLPQSVEKGRPPFPVHMPKAIVYPRKAVWKRWEGQAVIAAEILPGGTVGRTALTKSSGHGLLDNTAQEAIKTWKFAAESEQDDVVPQYVDIPVTFKLEGR